MTTTQTRAEAQLISELPLENVLADPDNPRSDVGDITELTASIADLGVEQPITVRLHPTEPSKYMVIAGHRRRAASIAAGQMWIPSIVRHHEPDRVLISQLVENVQRADLTPLDEGRAYLRLTKEFGFTQDDVAKKVGRSPGHVSKRVALLGLPSEAQRAVAGGHLKLDTALKLTKLVKSKANLKVVVDELQRAVTSDLADAEEGKEPEWPADILVSSQIDRQLGNIERAEKRDAAKAKVEADGLKLVATWGQYEYPAKYRKPEKGETATHAHVTDSGVVTKLISAKVKAPSTKTAKAPKENPTQKAAAEARAANEAKVEELAARREIACTDLLRTDMSVSHVHRYLVACDEFITDKAAARRYLGIDDEGLEEYASKSARAANDAARALVFADAEALITGDMLDRMGQPSVLAGWGEPAARLHFELLVANGYELDPFEVAYLGTKAPKKAK